MPYATHVFEVCAKAESHRARGGERGCSEKQASSKGGSQAAGSKNVGAAYYSPLATQWTGYYSTFRGVAPAVDRDGVGQRRNLVAPQ